MICFEIIISLDFILYKSQNRRMLIWKLNFIFFFPGEFCFQVRCILGKKSSFSIHQATFYLDKVNHVLAFVTYANIK